MRTLSSAETLTLWERGTGLHPLDRGLLATSFAGLSSDKAIADWPLGARNHALLDLHAQWFAPQLEAWTSCLQCGEKVEFELDVASLMESEKQQETVAVGDQVFRLPTSRDLAQVATAGDEHSAAIRLLERCRLGTTDSPVWTDEILEAVGESLALADPLAETRLALSCPSCRCCWDESIDIASFIWAELEARARRLIWEVHSLASHTAE